jgi:hypothetical protein
VAQQNAFFSSIYMLCYISDKEAISPHANALAFSFSTFVIYCPYLLFAILNPVSIQAFLILSLGFPKSSPGFVKGESGFYL